MKGVVRVARVGGWVGEGEREEEERRVQARASLAISTEIRAFNSLASPVSGCDTRTCPPCLLGQHDALSDSSSHRHWPRHRRVHTSPRRHIETCKE